MLYSLVLVVTFQFTAGFVHFFQSPSLVHVIPGVVPAVLGATSFKLFSESQRGPKESFLTSFFHGVDAELDDFLQKVITQL